VPIFKLSAHNASVEWSYFAQKCIKFHLQPSRFEKFYPGRNPRTPAHMDREGKRRGGKGLKGSYLKKGKEERTGDGRGRRK